jgi:hypothetical protein
MNSSQGAGMQRILIVLAIFYSFISSQFSFASEVENQLRCLYSEPTTKQNVDINVAECSYLPIFEAGQMTDSFQLYPVLSLGSIFAKNDDGLLIGGGLGLNYEFYQNFDLYFEGGTYWLSDFEYGKKGAALKNYGGNWIAFAKLGVQYNFSTNWTVGYAFIHLSNGNIYDVNPAFNGNSITLGYRF